jgi:hypothetical protein
VVCLAAGLMVWLGGRGLGPVERRRLQIILVSIGVRVLSVAGLFR